ncbi:MAG: serine/threonine-protein phosphatase [bacterium]|nr:serine/threonine-protein phosphatase [bacterium]
MTLMKTRFLSEYTNASFVIQQKAYVLLWMSLVTIPVMATITIINHIMLQGLLHNIFLFINISFIVFVCIGLTLLRKGKYNAAVILDTTLLSVLALMVFLSRFDYFMKTGNSSSILLMYVVIVFSALFGSRFMTSIISLLFLLAILTLFICVMILNPAYAFHPDNFYYIMGFGVNSSLSVFFIYIFSFFISRITEKALGKTEEELQKNKELNLSLELKVKKRTEALETAKRVTDQDIDMAANVQSALFPKDPPHSSEWDIAFTFQPMSGVSGDLYDFYEKDGRLLGLTLCDVSGHGVASGLITMIARTVIQRNFFQGQEDPLNSILEKTNRELIAEIGKLDNYLSGILLRFENSTVEYVNAGHPSVLLKKGSSGAVENLDAGKQNFKGALLGLSAFQSPFGVISYNMDPHDLLLLFSDGLSDCMNKKDEVFDKYLPTVLSEAPAGSAEEILGFLLQGFSEFTGQTDSQDDITVLVVRKR